MGQMAERLKGELEELLESGTAAAEESAARWWCKPVGGRCRVGQQQRQRRGGRRLGARVALWERGPAPPRLCRRARPFYGASICGGGSTRCEGSGRFAAAAVAYSVDLFDTVGG